MMDFTPAIPTFIITLREGVEAALVIGIVLACLHRAHQPQLSKWVYQGIVAGLLGSLLIGLFLGMALYQIQAVFPNLEAVVKPLLATLFCSLAIIMLSWMLIWMTQQARRLKTTLEANVSKALDDTDSAAGWSIFSLICIAVLREGFETVLFLFTNWQDSSFGVVGIVLGLLGATAMGLALYKWGIKINLRQFFQVMGVLLLLIVSGLVVSAFKNLDGVLVGLTQLNLVSVDLCLNEKSCILGPLVWDTSQYLSDQQLPGVILKTLFGYRDHLYLLQAGAYLLFWVGIGGRYFQSLKGETPPLTSATK